MPVKRRYIRRDLEVTACELRRRARAAAKKAIKGSPKQRHEAEDLAKQAVEATHAANRDYFINMAQSYVHAAYAAIDKINVMCEKRKYRVFESDRELIQKPLQQIMQDLDEELAIAIRRKNVVPSMRQIGLEIPDMAGAE